MVRGARYSQTEHLRQRTFMAPPRRTFLTLPSAQVPCPAAARPSGLGKASCWLSTSKG